MSMKKLILVIMSIILGVGTLSDKVLAICNHVWVEDTSEYEAPTCSTEGKRWYNCSVCYDYKTETIPATGVHKWSEWEEWSKATCTKDGEERRTCSECYETEKRTLPATGVHQWTEWKADGYLCEDGKDTRYCEDCYKEETRSRKGDGSHLWSEWEIDTKPDCLNKGKRYRKCYNCYTYEYEDIPADKDLHEWSSWYAVNEATALNDGTTRRNCYTCNKVEEKVTKRLKATVTLSTKKKTLKVGKSFALKIKRYTYGDEVSKYTSNNKKVATVSSYGTVEAKKKGKAKITVKMKSGCKATCNITVK